MCAGSAEAGKGEEVQGRRHPKEEDVWYCSRKRVLSNHGGGLLHFIVVTDVQEAG